MSDAGRVSGNVLGLLFRLNREAWGRIASDFSLPQSVKTAIYMHLTYPWDPRFLAVGIAPIHSGLEAFLGRGVFQIGPETYFNPSDAFWKWHAESAHAPAGTGCDPEAHVRWLTRQSPEGLFSYAIVSKDGSIRIAESSDFAEECMFFTQGRNRALSGSNPMRPGPVGRPLIGPAFSSPLPTVPLRGPYPLMPFQHPQNQAPQKSSKADCPVCRTFGGGPRVW